MAKNTTPETALIKKLTDAGLDKDGVEKLRSAKMLRESALVASTTEQLERIGLPMGDAMLVKEIYPAAAATVQPAAQAAAVTSGMDPALVAILQKLAESTAGQATAMTAFTQAQMAASSIACGSCGNTLPKDLEGELCPVCGNQLSTGIVSCGLCGSNVPKGVLNAQYCTHPECNAPLVDGPDLDAMKYLVATQHESVIGAAQMLKSADTATKKKWAAQGKKVPGYVVPLSTKKDVTLENYKSVAQQRYIGLSLVKSQNW